MINGFIRNQRRRLRYQPYLATNLLPSQPPYCHWFNETILGGHADDEVYVAPLVSVKPQGGRLTLSRANVHWIHLSRLTVCLDTAMSAAIQLTSDDTRDKAFFDLIRVSAAAHYYLIVLLYVKVHGKFPWTRSSAVNVHICNCRATRTWSCSSGHSFRSVISWQPLKQLRCWLHWLQRNRKGAIKQTMVDWVLFTASSCDITSDIGTAIISASLRRQRWHRRHRYHRYHRCHRCLRRHDGNNLLNAYCSHFTASFDPMYRKQWKLMTNVTNNKSDSCRIRKV